LTTPRLFYRAHQFWLALSAKPDPAGLEAARGVLTLVQMALFIAMPPSEQRHALKVLQKLLRQGESHPDLLVAALLHDVGKQRHPLHLLERVVIVLGQKLFPQKARHWGAEPPDGLHSLPAWQRPFVVAAQHPAWGAQMACEAGVSRLGQALIRRHQEQAGGDSRTLEDILLSKLQAVDDES
jgi:hypothetical protein